MTSVQQAEWFQGDATQIIIHMFQNADTAAFFVGGCVRNSLMNVEVTDVDMSTPVRPEAVMALAQAAQLKVIPTGLEHGTVTVIAKGQSFEITTFRNDVTTDGRRAVVAFEGSLEEDARRRDFTMNAIYADLAGYMIDPLDGMNDLLERRVRFIGQASDRIKEDYLRILRFFRFHAIYGDHAAGLDPDALAACASHLEGLAQLSKERISSEVIKLLSAADPSTAIGAMEASGVLQALFPAASGRSLYPYVANEFDIDPMARLAALGGIDIDQSLRLSKKQLNRFKVFRSSIGDGRSLNEIAFVEGADIAFCIAALRSAMFEQPLPAQTRAQVLNAAEQVFPIRAKDLMPMFSGAELGGALKTLQRAWLESGFALTKPELLKLLDPKSK